MNDMHRNRADERGNRTGSGNDEIRRMKVGGSELRPSLLENAAMQVNEHSRSPAEPRDQTGRPPTQVLVHQGEIPFAEMPGETQQTDGIPQTVVPFNETNHGSLILELGRQWPVFLQEPCMHCES